MPEITASDVHRRFGPFVAIDGIDFHIPHGSFTTLLGPSGCGKTTTLRMLAGFDRPNRGTIRIGDRTVVDASKRGAFVPPQNRGLGVVFQSYALWPHMTVYQQVAYPLATRRVPKAEIARRVHLALATVKLPDVGALLPGELSGGQQQRVAFARAIATEPAVMLLDEPLSNLDAELRGEMRDELADIHRRLGITMVYVTHDQTEALALSDQVLVMRKGRIVERGNPRDIYSRPSTAYGAEFVGGSNCIAARLAERLGDGRATLELANGQRVSAVVPEGLGESARVLLVVKPEDVELASEGDDANVIAGRVAHTAYLGPRIEVGVECGSDIAIEGILAKHYRLEPGDAIRIRLPAEAIHVVPTDVAAAGPARPGAPHR